MTLSSVMFVIIRTYPYEGRVIIIALLGYTGLGMSGLLPELLNAIILIPSRYPPIFPDI